MTRAAGLDIGSRTAKLVVLEGERMVASARIETTPTVGDDVARLLARHPHERLVVTGYGRALAEVAFEAVSVTEIKAFARGVGATFPGARTILDIGGQDTKAIVTDGAGRPLRFEMNDRCAAGAGRFVEMMAHALGYSTEEFGAAALAGQDGIKLSAMCAVFAESEVVGLMTRGAPREDVARAVHRAIAGRAIGMLQRVGLTGGVVFAGGGAKNPCLVATVRDALAVEVLVPDDPQMVGAHGAALIAAEIVWARGPELGRTDETQRTRRT
jgi:predicted CoA-substrate-specific enzyme activase